MACLLENLLPCCALGGRVQQARWFLPARFFFCYDRNLLHLYCTGLRFRCVYNKLAPLTDLSIVDPACSSGHRL